MNLKWCRFRWRYHSGCIDSLNNGIYFGALAAFWPMNFSGKFFLSP
jgi:hypothetical protein